MRGNFVVRIAIKISRNIYSRNDDFRSVLMILFVRLT